MPLWVLVFVWDWVQVLEPESMALAEVAKQIIDPIIKAEDKVQSFFDFIGLVSL